MKRLMILSKVISKLILSCLPAIPAFVGAQIVEAQVRLENVEVYEYRNGDIAIYKNGDWARYRLVRDRGQNFPPRGPGGPRWPGGPGDDPRGPGRPDDRPPIPGSGHGGVGAPTPVAAPMYFTPSRAAGGSVDSIDLSSLSSVTQVQITAARRRIYIHSAVVELRNGQSYEYNTLLRQDLSEGQSTVLDLSRIDTRNLRTLTIQAEGFQANDVSYKVELFTSGVSGGSSHPPVVSTPAVPRCGGCNQYGCYLEGGACNQYGCYAAGNYCNQYGCYVAGGGCNQYGCYYPGGSCNQHGCQKQAPESAGRANTRPVCQ